MEAHEIVALQRQNPTRQVVDWGEWIIWMTQHYACSQADIARAADVTGSYLSQIKNGKEPSEEIKLCLSSFAVDNGPKPPDFRISRRLTYLLDLHMGSPCGIEAP